MRLWPANRAVGFFTIAGVCCVVGIALGLVRGVDSRIPGVTLWVVGVGGVMCAIVSIILVLRHAGREGNQ